MNLKLVSFNIRCVWKEDGINSFVHRAGLILDKLDREKPDVVCFQETTEQIAPFLKRHLPEYELHFQGRNPDLGGEGLCAALKKETVEMLELSRFWLSPTPYEPGSRFEKQSLCPRICQALTLRLKGGEPFRIYHSHLDHESDEARILGIRQLLAYAKEKQEQRPLPLFLLGDFNAYPESETIRFCDSFDSLLIRDLTRETGGTFHDFGRAQPLEKIDYIYADKDTAKLPHSVSLWKDTENGIYLSDHYPICLSIEL